MEVVRITPRGYCHGVVSALRIAREVAEQGGGEPVHMLGHLIHNTHATRELEELGVTLVDPPTRLEGLDAIDRGVVIFTAHGVSPEVRRRAEARGLRTVDATCVDVERTHDLVRELAGRGYEIVYVGRRGHPEPEGVIGEAPGHVHLVQDLADVEALDIRSERLAVTCQTTLSIWDTEELIEAVRRRYPGCEVHNEICRATQDRQEAAVRAAAGVDLVIVVGSPRSSNSRRLAEVVRTIAGKPAHLVDTVEELRPEWFQGARRVGVTSGASTPTHLTRRVVEHLERFEAAGSEPV
ncbi:MAG: 4-hydroxy-3-methylbut-2-enyl diphosphate reductase [Chloroflexi bacterium]|nr:MAG: 4-hydroxy-3-methylbut-2-enyl diphosphate reductase [Chloroflexota bacterium]